MPPSLPRKGDICHGLMKRVEPGAWAVSKSESALAFSLLILSLAHHQETLASQALSPLPQQCPKELEIQTTEFLLESGTWLGACVFRGG